MKYHIKYRILLVIDNTWFCNTFRHILEDLLKDKVEAIKVASSISEATEMMNENFFHITFIDNDMNEMAGQESIFHISQNRPGTPIVALLRLEDLLSIEMIINAGARQIIIKDTFTDDSILNVFSSLFTKPNIFKESA